MPTQDIEKQRLYRRRWYERNKERQRQYKERRQQDLLACVRSLKTKCSTCGERDVACLLFHHLDGQAKSANIALAVTNGWSKERILGEIAKCLVLCSNCHARLHFPRTTVMVTAKPPKLRR
jgi:hypothetical protein